MGETVAENLIKLNGAELRDKLIEKYKKKGGSTSCNKRNKYYLHIKKLQHLWYVLYFYLFFLYFYWLYYILYIYLQMDLEKMLCVLIVFVNDYIGSYIRR